MASIIRALYRGELHPEERGDNDSVRSEVLYDGFGQSRERLSKALEGKPKEWLEELLQTHDALLSDAAYDGFRQGFVLGAHIVMEVCSCFKMEGE